MRLSFPLCVVLTLTIARFAGAQALQIPARVEAGTALSVPTSGSGSATLYIVGPGQVLKREVALGQTVTIGSDDLQNAGHYSVFLVEPSSTESGSFDLLPGRQAVSMSFLAKPSRIAVDLPDGISGVVYLFDAFRNLIVQPATVSFQLSEPGATPQERSTTTRDGVAWLKITSAPKAGNAQFEATTGNLSQKRVVEQVPGDPCNLKMSARASGDRIELETDPVRDCRGNPVPDGTIITFSESYNGTQSTVDAPLKRGVARTEMPAHDGAVITVATGVVLGNQIHWQSGARSEK